MSDPVKKESLNTMIDRALEGTYEIHKLAGSVLTILNDDRKILERESARPVEPSQISGTLGDMEIINNGLEEIHKLMTTILDSIR